MPSPRFQHGYTYDVFISYTHADDQPDGGRRWVAEFTTDLRARLEIVSGRSVDIWRDEQKLGGADRFDATIKDAVRESAVLLTVLSPSYFNSKYCEDERGEFRNYSKAQGREFVGTKARVVKVAKFPVPLTLYPDDMRELLEYRFYSETPGSSVHREFHLSEDPAIRGRYSTRVDDVAQEIAGLLGALEPQHAAPTSKGAVYLAETTSDLEPQRDVLRRHLRQLGFTVLPDRDLKLLRGAELAQVVATSLQSCQLAVHPIGAYYGVVPEGADGKSIVRMQLEASVADAGGHAIPRVIWLPADAEPSEASQIQWLKEVRTDYPGRGFELIERPSNVLVNRLEDLLTPRSSAVSAGGASGIYLICDNRDRPAAKVLRAFFFNQGRQVEWTPMDIASDLGQSPEHQKLLRRNRAHVVLHGATGESWIQERIRELDTAREGARADAPIQAIVLANPQRPDKDDILVRDEVKLVPAYADIGAETLQPLLSSLGPAGAGA